VELMAIPLKGYTRVSMERNEGRWGVFSSSRKNGGPRPPAFLGARTNVGLAGLSGLSGLFGFFETNAQE